MNLTVFPAIRSPAYFLAAFLLIYKAHGNVFLATHAQLLWVAQ